MRFVLMLLVVISLVGCGESSKLSRSKAEAVIQKYAKFNTATGSFSNEEVNLVWDGSEHMSDRLNSLLSELARRNLLSFTRQRGFPAVFTIRITDNGAKFAVDDPNGKGRNAVKLCDRKVAAITGIEQPTPQFAQVTFTYKAANPTPFGETTPNVCSPPAVGEGIAELRLFDDGWRVGKIKLSDQSSLGLGD